MPNLIDNTPTKTQESERIAELVAEYLAKGKKIHVVPPVNVVEKRYSFVGVPQRGSRFSSEK